MSDSTDRFFLRPRLLLSARQVGVYDAVNLVIYAKFPLISVRRGRDLVAGFVPRDETSTQGIFTKIQTDRLVGKFGTEVDSLRYPIGPCQYEPLLERLLSDGEDALPFFYSEHHVMVARRRRIAAFTRVNRELLEEVRRGDVILQRSDSERIHLMASDAWMTQKTFSAYLERQGVAPWWEIETNLASHARLERIHLSDTLDLPNSETLEDYDAQQVPSFVFAKMLMKRSQRPRGYAQSVQRNGEASRVFSTVEKPEDARSLKRAKNQNAIVPTGELSDSSVGDTCSPHHDTKQLRPRSQGAESSSIEREVHSDWSSNEVPVGVESPTRREFPAATDQGMLTKKDVAKLIGMSISSLDGNLRRQPDFPAPLTYGSTTTLRWRRSDILQWLESRDRATQ